MCLDFGVIPGDCGKNLGNTVSYVILYDISDKQHCQQHSDTGKNQQKQAMIGGTEPTGQ